jgi:hypothetical protein
MGSEGREPSEAEILRERFLALAAAHNKAVLFAVVLCVVLALGFLAGVLAYAPLPLPWPLLAVAAFVVAGLLLWRAVRLHGRVIRDLGPARRAAVELALALRAEAGHALPLAALEAAFAREDLLRALDFLGRLGLAWAEARPEGDVVVVARRAFESAT